MYFSKLLLADIVEFGVSKGADRNDLCQTIGIDLSKEINPNEHISYQEMIDALNITGQTINDENLGLHLGEQLMLKGKKQVDNIMQNSPTIDEAFANAVFYSKLISDALKSSLEKNETTTKVLFEVNPNWATHENHAVQQIIDMTLVCTLKSIFLLSNKKYFPTEVHLNGPTIKKRNEYYRIFDCVVKFNEPIPCIIFSNPILYQPVPSHNLGLLASLKKEANQAIEQIQTEPNLVIQIKEIILKTLPRKSNINEIATELNLSTRTLQRKLQQLKTNYKDTEKDILIKLAKKLVLQGDLSIDEIGYLLGFSEGSALIRFFKNEMNITPKKYRTLNK